MKTKFTLLVLTVVSFSSCNKYLDKDYWTKDNHHHEEDASSFHEIGSIDIGDAGAAEISAFDPKTNRLFVVNNGATNKIDVIDLTNPTSPTVITSIPLAKYNGAVNSVDVSNGMLAAAIESADKQENGRIVVFNTSNYAELKVIEAGALPDMITFSPDGRFIVTANEGEPSTDYTNDPPGTVTIVSVHQHFATTTIDFSAFASMQQSLMQKGLRVFGPGASFAQDMEPEYVTISKNSRTAWVTLQENNAIAQIDLLTRSVTDIFPLGFKNYSLPGNGIDPSDRDDVVSFRQVPVFGIYMPDAIAVLEKKGIPHLFTVNEGDAREYDAFEEIERVKDLDLDESAFENADELKAEDQLGRLNVTKTLGDANNDGKYEALYSMGSRSFSIWNGFTGEQLFDSKNNLEQDVDDAGFYDDGRSDDKGVEPEGIALGKVGNNDIAFIGLERADAVAIYDISEPIQPRLLSVLETGDGPEGVLFISKNESPLKKSLLVISSENDGVIRVYAP